MLKATILIFLIGLLFARVQMWLWTERSRVTFWLGTWDRGCHFARGHLMAASGLKDNTHMHNKNNFWFYRFLFVCLLHCAFLCPSSISALQWLCNADKRTHSPPNRLYTFFSTLYSALVRLSESSRPFYSTETSSEFNIFFFSIS